METGSFNGMWCMCFLTTKCEVSPETRESFSWPSYGALAPAWHSAAGSLVVTRNANPVSLVCIKDDRLWQLVTSEPFKCLVFLQMVSSPLPFGSIFACSPPTHFPSSWSSSHSLTGTDCQFKWLNHGVMMPKEKCDYKCLHLETKHFRWT